MEKKLKQFIESAQEVRLSDEAFLRIRERLVSYARSRLAPSSYAPSFGIRSPFMSWLRKPAFAMPLVFFIAFGGASAYAATGSLPGDALYPIKVGITEPIKGLFAISSKAKAEWQVSLAETRLQEMEHLAAREELTPSAAEASQQRFDATLQNAEETIQKLSEVNPDAAVKVGTALSTALKRHGVVLTALGASATTSSAMEARSLGEYLKNNNPRVQGSATSTIEVEESPKAGRQGNKVQVDRD